MDHLCFVFSVVLIEFVEGAQWLSGRVLDSRVRATPASLRCVLEQDTLILAYYRFNPT